MWHLAQHLGVSVMYSGDDVEDPIATISRDLIDPGYPNLVGMDFDDIAHLLGKAIITEYRFWDLTPIGPYLRRPVLLRDDPMARRKSLRGAVVLLSSEQESALRHVALVGIVAFIRLARVRCETEPGFELHQS